MLTADRLIQLGAGEIRRNNSAFIVPADIAGNLGKPALDGQIPPAVVGVNHRPARIAVNRRAAIGTIDRRSVLRPRHWLPSVGALWPIVPRIRRDYLHTFKFAQADHQRHRPPGLQDGNEFFVPTNGNEFFVPTKLRFRPRHSSPSLCTACSRRRSPPIPERRPKADRTQRVARSPDPRNYTSRDRI